MRGSSSCGNSSGTKHTRGSSGAKSTSQRIVGQSIDESRHDGVVGVSCQGCGGDAAQTLPLTVGEAGEDLGAVAGVGGVERPHGGGVVGVGREVRLPRGGARALLLEVRSGRAPSRGCQGERDHGCRQRSGEAGSTNEPPPARPVRLGGCVSELIYIGNQRIIP